MPRRFSNESLGKICAELTVETGEDRNILEQISNVVKGEWLAQK